MILRQGHDGLKPELRFPFRALNMHVTFRLLAREKVKPKAAISEYGRAHPCGLRQISGGHITIELTGASRLARGLRMQAA
jgi:hypothetical protein